MRGISDQIRDGFRLGRWMSGFNFIITGEDVTTGKIVCREEGAAAGHAPVAVLESARRVALLTDKLYSKKASELRWTIELIPSV